MPGLPIHMHSSESLLQTVMTPITAIELRDWLRLNSYPSKRLTYTIAEATTEYALFAATPTTGRVMLPIGLIQEWIAAFESGKIRIHQSPREMRIIVAEKSPWAGQLHSFETHLAAIVQRWATDGPRIGQP